MVTAMPNNMTPPDTVPGESREMSEQGAVERALGAFALSLRSGGGSHHTDAILDAARAELAELHAMRDSLQDPALVHVNVLRGTIKLPDYYVRTTDTNGPWAARDERERRLRDALNWLDEVLRATAPTEDGQDASLLLRSGQARRWRKHAEALRAAFATQEAAHA